MTIDEFLTDCETLPSIGPTMRRKLVALVRKLRNQRDCLICIALKEPISAPTPALCVKSHDDDCLAIIDGEVKT